METNWNWIGEEGEKSSKLFHLQLFWSLIRIYISTIYLVTVVFCYSKILFVKNE